MSDLISRQDAIDAADIIIKRDTSGSNAVVNAMIAWSEYIRTLPSVEPEKCGDCISREELKQKFQWLAKATKYGNKDSEQQNFSYSTMMMYEIADMIEDAIDSCESVEPERKTGKWIRGEAYPHRIYCSECYKTFIPNDKLRAWADGNLPRKYCPECGAKMEV